MPEITDKTSAIFKCPGCGAYLEFSPKSQSLVCPHCGTQKDFEKDFRIIKKPFDTQAAEAGRLVISADTCLNVCKSCGAEVEALNAEIASKCPFCGATNITRKENISGLKPDMCIPFTLEAKEAESSFKVWLKKKWFVPTALKKHASANEIKGVYSPCYGFDTSTYSNYSGVLGKHYTVVEGSGKNRRVVVKTRYFNINGSYAKDFSDIMIECSPHFDQRVLDRLRPFSMDKRAVYGNEYLSGFTADRYDKELSQGWVEAKGKIDGEIKRLILSRYDYDVVQSLSISSSYNDIAYNYMLLPIYVSNYTFKQKLYNFFVNGNTGRVSGAVPRSLLKILRAVLIGAAIVAGAAIAYNYFAGA